MDSTMMDAVFFFEYLSNFYITKKANQPPLHLLQLPIVLHYLKQMTDSQCTLKRQAQHPWSFRIH